MCKDRASYGALGRAARLFAVCPSPRTAGGLMTAGEVAFKLGAVTREEFWHIACLPVTRWIFRTKDVI